MGLLTAVAMMAAGWDVLPTTRPRLSDNGQWTVQMGGPQKMPLKFGNPCKPQYRIQV